MELKVKKVHSQARLPVYATPGSACFDLACLEGKEVSAVAPVTFRTGLAFEVPEGHVMLIFSRSGHGFKNSTRLANCVGVIDADYRGEVLVKLTRDDTYATLELDVKAGERVAQAMVVPVDRVQFVEVDTLSETERGEGGFGSTNK